MSLDDLLPLVTDNVLADIERLKGRYNPTVYRTMIGQFGAVETPKRLLADPRSRRMA